MKKSAVFLAFGFAAICILAADNQQGRWLTPDDATAKFILDAEEQWDEAACTHNRSPESVLADDFLGTAPDGSRYDKKEEVADTQDKSKSANQCHQTNAKVRLFGENVAMVYGDAFSVRKDKNPLSTNDNRALTQLLSPKSCRSLGNSPGRLLRRSSLTSPYYKPTMQA